MKKFLIIFLSFVAMLFIVSVFLPSEGKVERSVTIKAPIDSVYKKILYIKEWQHWTVWFEQDPTAIVEYSGPVFGPLATMQWKGEDSKGKIILTEVQSPNFVNYVMRFQKYAPFYGSFNFKQNDDSTVTIDWKITFDAGKNPTKKYFCLFMDQFMGKDMEQSLNKLMVNCEL